MSYKTLIPILIAGLMGFTQGARAAADLGKYELADDYQEKLKGINGASGVTFWPKGKNHAQDSLLVISNDTLTIYEFDLKGHRICSEGENIAEKCEPREITLVVSEDSDDLKNFDDPEGITHIGRNNEDNDEFVIVEEKRAEISLVEITDKTTEIKRPDAGFKRCKFPEKVDGNKGWEGIAFIPDENSSPGTGNLLVVKESVEFLQVRVENFKFGSTSGNCKLILLSPKTALRRYMGPEDLSGLHYDTDTKTLLVLSDDSEVLFAQGVTHKKPGDPDLLSVVLAPTYTILFLEDGDLPQAEGVTMDAEGNIYIVSEHKKTHSHFMKLEPPTKTP